MSLPISRQLLAGLLAAMVLSVIALLKPDIEPQAASEDVLLAVRHNVRASSQHESATPWLREPQSPHIASLNQGFAPPPPPPPPPVIQQVMVPVVIPRPVAPNPSFTYLGRMMRDDQVYVFLGRGDDVEVVAIGDAVDGSWRIESVSDTDVKLRYLPLNELRQLAMSDH